MALGNSAISQVRGQLDTIVNQKSKILQSIATVEYVKTNNDLTLWADDTALGSKWSSNIDQMISQSKDVCGKIDELIAQTNEYLAQQEAENNKTA